MNIRINEVVLTLLANHTPQQIADELGISAAMISTWKNKENDFTPRLPIARGIYKAYNLGVWPYSEYALQGN